MILCRKSLLLGLLLTSLSCAIGNAEEAALAFMEGVWVSISPPGPHIVITTVGLGAREASLPNLGQASIRASKGEQGSNLLISGPGFECYYYVVSLAAQTRMVWEVRGGSNNCPPTTLYERVVDGRKEQRPPEIPNSNAVRAPTMDQPTRPLEPERPVRPPATERPRITRCTVADPTGTPLNIRAAPQGNILRTIHNGVRVSAVEAKNDYKGSSWSRIMDGQGNSLGWVITRFLDCSAISR
jgi:hypothetical protein